MANENNLKPIRSKSEARKRGSNGGKKSGEARRERKALKERLLALLDTKEDGVTKADKMCASLINEALNGNVKAYEVIRDTIGEKPVDKIEAEIKSNEAQAELKEYMELLKKGG